MSDEDIALAHINPDHAVDFVHYEQRVEEGGTDNGNQTDPA